MIALANPRVVAYEALAVLPTLAKRRVLSVALMSSTSLDSILSDMPAWGDVNLADQASQSDQCC